MRGKAAHNVPAETAHYAPAGGRNDGAGVRSGYATSHSRRYRAMAAWRGPASPYH